MAQCNKCGSCDDLRTDETWAGTCRACVEEVSQPSLNEGKCPTCSSGLEFLDEDDYGIAHYMCAECGANFGKLAGWWYV